MKPCFILILFLFCLPFSANTFLSTPTGFPEMSFTKGNNQQISEKFANLGMNFSFPLLNSSGQRNPSPDSILEISMRLNEIRNTIFSNESKTLFINGKCLVIARMFLEKLKKNTTLKNMPWKICYKFIGMISQNTPLYHALLCLNFVNNHFIIYDIFFNTIQLYDPIIQNKPFLINISPKGMIAGSRFTINSDISSPQQKIDRIDSALLQNSFVVVWSQGIPNNMNIYARLFDLNCVPLGNSIKVNLDSNNAMGPAVVALTGGGFVVAWSAYNQTYAFWNATFRIFKSNATPINNYIGYQTSYSSPDTMTSNISLGAFNNGNFVLSFNLLQFIILQPVL